MSDYVVASSSLSKEHLERCLGIVFCGGVFSVPVDLNEAILRHAIDNLPLLIKPRKLVISRSVQDDFVARELMREHAFFRQLIPNGYEVNSQLPVSDWCLLASSD